MIINKETMCLIILKSLDKTCSADVPARRLPGCNFIVNLLNSSRDKVYNQQGPDGG